MTGCGVNTSYMQIMRSTFLLLLLLPLLLPKLKQNLKTTLLILRTFCLLPLLLRPQPQPPLRSLTLTTLMSSWHRLLLP